MKVDRSCKGWDRLTDDGKIADIVAVGGYLYERHMSVVKDCQVYQYRGGFWDSLGCDKTTVNIAAGP